ncbi:hypothetical protein V3G39_07055 [Dermatophilaceae bacterium Sec6.4]|nr:hypothetical protein [Actinomycetota bacterium]
MTDPTSMPNFPPPADEHPLRGRVLDVLQDMQAQPDLDTDGDVTYSVQEQQLFARCTEGDVSLLRIFGQWQITDDMPTDITKQLLACNDVTLSLNIIKTGIANGTLVVSGEHLVQDGDNLEMMVASTTQMVLQAVQLWHQTVLGEGPHVANTDPSELPGPPEGGPEGDSGNGLV